MNKEALSWSFITSYYYSKFLMAVKSMAWDERYLFLKEMYDAKYPENKWEERSQDPVTDMMEYVARKDYLHFFCMGFTVDEDGYYIVHRMMRKAMTIFRTLR